MYFTPSWHRLQEGFLSCIQNKNTHLTYCHYNQKPNFKTHIKVTLLQSNETFTKYKVLKLCKHSSGCYDKLGLFKSRINVVHSC